MPTETDEGDENGATVDDKTGKRRQFNPPSSEGGAKPSEPKVPTKTDDDGEIVAPVYDNTGKPQQINTPSSEGGAKPNEPQVPIKTGDDGEIVAPVYDNTGKPRQINTPSSEGGAKPNEPREPSKTGDGDEIVAPVYDNTGKPQQINTPSSEGSAKPNEPQVPTETDDGDENDATVDDKTGKRRQFNPPSSEGGAKPSEPKVPTKTDDDGEIVAPVYDNPGKPQQINTPSSEGGAKEEASTWDKDSEQKVVASKKDSSPRKTTDTASKGDSSNDEIVPVKQVSTKSSSLRKKVNTYFVRDEISIDPSLLGLLIPQDNEGSLMTMGVNRNDLKEHNVGEIVYSILNRPGAKDEDEIIIKHGMGDLCKDKAEAVIWTLNKEQMTEENNVSKRLHVLTAKFLF